MTQPKKAIVFVTTISLALIGTLLLPSCHKVYNCTCTFTDSTGKKTEQIVGAMNTTKSKAKKDCDNYPTMFKSSSTVTGCHI